MASTLRACIAQDVAAHADVAAFQFADPVRRQRAFVEFGEFLDILGARADQQFVDACPHARAVALAARLRAGGEHVMAAVLVQPVPAQALLRDHDHHHFGVRDRAALRHDAIHADGDQSAAMRVEHGGAERAAAAVFARCWRDSSIARPTRSSSLCVAPVVVGDVADPRRQGQMDLQGQHDLLRLLAGRLAPTRRAASRCG